MRYLLQPWQHINNLKGDQRGAVRQWAKSILSSWQRTLTIGSSQMDFQYTTLLSNSDITRYYTVFARTKKLVACFVSSSSMVQVVCLFVFPRQSCGRFYSFKNNANKYLQEDVECNPLGKNHKSLCVLMPH